MIILGWVKMIKEECTIDTFEFRGGVVLCLFIEKFHFGHAGLFCADISQFKKELGDGHILPPPLRGRGI